ncbi:MAG: hypothetical protein HRU06_00235 [Oceanospirillaceae bacterium]|nr:hypothetical protein [Oceanospirillaceae bacterium]
MPNNFVITKVFPALAILAIYGVGSLNLPGVIFLPIALSIAVLVFYITKRYGDKEHKKEITNKTDANKK